MEEEDCWLQDTCRVCVRGDILWPKPNVQRARRSRWYRRSMRLKPYYLKREIHSNRESTETFAQYCISRRLISFRERVGLGTVKSHCFSAWKFILSSSQKRKEASKKERTIAAFARGSFQSNWLKLWTHRMFGNAGSNKGALPRFCLSFRERLARGCDFAIGIYKPWRPNSSHERIPADYISFFIMFIFFLSPFKGDSF